MISGMRRYRGAKAVALFFAIVCLAGSAGAQVNAPSWWGTPDNDTISMSFLFSQSTWSPTPDTSVTPSWYGATTWAKGGSKTPQWATQLAGHNGVWGRTDGSPGQGYMEVQLDNQARPDWKKHVWYQFDAYQISAQICCIAGTDPSSVISNKHDTVEQLPYGWVRVTGSFDITPQPQWEKLTWTFDVQTTGKAVIDNIYIGTHCGPAPANVPEPASVAGLVWGMAALALRIRAKTRR